VGRVLTELGASNYYLVYTGGAMQCMCGGDAKTTSAARKTLNAVLTFYVCQDCKCVSGGVLYIENVEVAADCGLTPSGRMAFNSLTAENARRLYADAIIPQRFNTESQSAFNF
jgi:hypothetical protein